MDEFKIENGKLSAAVKIDKYGMTLQAMINGHQTTSFTVNEELLDMISDAINKYKSREIPHSIEF